MLAKLSLIALFALSLATLTAAASMVPVIDEPETHVFAAFAD